jgi:hypothetical protein
MNPKSLLFVCCIGLIALPGACAQACNAVEVTAVMSVGLFGEEIAWSIVDQDSSLVAGPFAGYETGAISTSTFCIDSGCYLVHTTDTYGDGWQGASLLLNGSDGSSQTIQMEAFLFESYTPIVWDAVCGCTDPDAANFDPDATVDNWSCFVCEGAPVYLSLTTEQSCGAIRPGKTTPPMLLGHASQPIVTRCYCWTVMGMAGKGVR